MMQREVYEGLAPAYGIYGCGWGEVSTLYKNGCELLGHISAHEQ